MTFSSAPNLTARGEAGDCEQTRGLLRREQPKLKKGGGKLLLTTSPVDAERRGSPPESVKVGMFHFCAEGGSTDAWSARGYWFLTELLCCYARCCRSEVRIRVNLRRFCPEEASGKAPSVSATV